MEKDNLKATEKMLEEGTGTPLLGWVVSSPDFGSGEDTVMARV